MIKLPHRRFIAATLIFLDDLDDVKQFLSSLYLPSPEDNQLYKFKGALFQGVPNEKRKRKTTKIKLLKSKNLQEFAHYFLENKVDQELEFDVAIQIQGHPQFRLPVQAGIMLKDKTLIKELIPFKIDDKTLDVYEKYFFSVEGMTLKDWVFYFKLLRTQYPDDASVLYQAKRGDLNTFRLRFKRIITLSPESIAQEINSVGLHVFRTLADSLLDKNRLLDKESLSFLRETRNWARLLMQSVGTMQKISKHEEGLEQVELEYEDALTDIPTIDQLK